MSPSEAKVTDAKATAELATMDLRECNRYDIPIYLPHLVEDVLCKWFANAPKSWALMQPKAD